MLAATGSWKRQATDLPEPLRARGPPNSLVLTSGPQDCDRISFCCFKPPACGHLSQQPQDTKTPSKRLDRARAHVAGLVLKHIRWLLPRGLCTGRALC